MVNISRNPSDKHDFHTLGAKNFEYFCCELHRYEDGIVSTHIYAPDGQKQFGIDHLAFRADGNVEAGQSKAYERFGPAQIQKAADEFLDHVQTHWKGKNIVRFILFVSCAVKSKKACDEILVQVSRFKKLGIDFALWSESTIYGRLGAAPGVVRNYLGQEFHEKLFGKPGSQLAELMQAVVSGNDKAFKASGILSRLNQASIGEIAELRRQARRGEVDIVIDRLESTLQNSAAAEALSPENKAEMLRLLAGLLISKDEFVRVKALLDEADAASGSSAKLRAMLTLESVGPREALLCSSDDDVGVSEVKAVAHLRLGAPDAALEELHILLSAEKPSAEILRLAALSELVRGDRNRAVELARSVDYR